MSRKPPGWRKGVCFRDAAPGLATCGLERRLGAELVVPASGASSPEERHRLLAYLCDYILGEDAVVRAGETIAYGYWMLRFDASPAGLELWELTPDAEDWVRGVDTAIRYHREQYAVCADAQADFTPPRGDQLVVVSAGVREGDPVQGVRYAIDRAMSGWYLSTDRYDGNIESMEILHAYHVTADRPELARFLALPPGWRFYEDGSVEVDAAAATGD